VATARPKGGGEHDRDAAPGEKVWVSRLTEAAGIVVFFRDPAGQISAAIVGADAPGLDREPTTSAGLTGWTWGVLRLHEGSR
jgi:alkylation response protein AidB-like acyl-CoA dehydrogenase